MWKGLQTFAKAAVEAAAEKNESRESLMATMASQMADAASRSREGTTSAAPGAASTSSSAGLAMGAAAAFCKTVAAEVSASAQKALIAAYGDEVFGLLTALAGIVMKVSGELKTREMRYGLMLAFPLLRLAHQATPPPRTSSALADDPDLAAQARHWAYFAAAAYGKRNADEVDVTASVEERVAKKLEGLAEVKMAYLPARGVQCPGHFVAVDYARRAVVLGVRGTANLSDAITDAVGNSVPLEEYPGVETHQAILAAAKEVLRRTRELLAQELATNPGFGVAVTGHSLGAGTAILCALLLNADPLPGRPRLRCFAYAPPPCISEAAHAGVAAVEIHAFVNRYDLVPRVSLHNVYMLGREAVAVDQLDMGLQDRIALGRSRRTDGEEESVQEKEQKHVLAAAVEYVKEQEKREPHPDFRPHFIPGRVWWIDSDADPPQALLSDCREFQALLFRSFQASLNDHRVTRYIQALEALPPPTVTFPSVG